MTEINKIYNINCITLMKSMPKEFIDLTITSPPYDNTRTVRYDRLIEFNLPKIGEGLFRITKNGGILVWIVADQTKNFCETMTSFNHALFFKSIGFNLLDTMIYYKITYAPAYPTLRRYANQFEYMFIFTKGKPKTFNPIKIPLSKGSLIRNKSMHSHSFRQDDGTLKTKTIISNNTMKDATNVWSYATGINSSKDPIAFDHPAIFPEKLAKDHILTWSNPNDLVFDPMCGSGTTCKMAKLYKRNFIGCDISSKYVEIANERINGVNLNVS